jgi:hypothetical protein
MGEMAFVEFKHSWPYEDLSYQDSECVYFSQIILTISFQWKNMFQPDHVPEIYPLFHHDIAIENGPVEIVSYPEGNHTIHMLFHHRFTV